MSVKDRRVWHRFSSASVAAALFLCWLLVLPVAGSSPLPQEGTVPCLSSSDTLEDLVYCFYDYVPDRYSTDGRDGFDVPTAEEMTQWPQVVERMMNGECETIDLSSYDWGSDFTVTAFTDVEASSTYGSASPPVAGDKVLELRSNLIRYHPTWIANVPGESPECHLNGTTNVEGRLLNGVPGDQVCGTEASGYSGHFIHIEQHYDYRHAEDWFEVISDAWPVTYFPLVIRDAAAVGWQSPLR